MPLTMEEFDALDSEVRKRLQEGSLTEEEVRRTYLGGSEQVSTPTYTSGTFRPFKGKPRRNLLSLRDRG